MNPPAQENPYKSPEFPNSATNERTKNSTDSYKRILHGLFWAFGQTIFFALWDVGDVQWLLILALIAWWISILLIVLRYHFGRSHSVSRWDIIIIKHSGWPAFILIFVIACLKAA
jgi:hypothetical protein